MKIKIKDYTKREKMKDMIFTGIWWLLVIAVIVTVIIKVK